MDGEVHWAKPSKDSVSPGGTGQFAQTYFESQNLYPPSLFRPTHSSPLSYIC